MDALTTYEFYKDTYYGETIEESAFPKWLSRATDKMNYLTYGNITEENRTVYDRQIQKAVCALMDLMFSLKEAEDKANVKDEGNVKSVSSGSESVTYAEHETKLLKVLADKKAQDRLMQETIAEYLGNTGLMYAGV